MIEGSKSVPYLWLTDPDPGGPKHTDPRQLVKVEIAVTQKSCTHTSFISRMVNIGVSVRSSYRHSKS